MGEELSDELFAAKKGCSRIETFSSLLAHVEAVVQAEAGQSFRASPVRECVFLRKNTHEHALSSRERHSSSVSTCAGRTATSSQASRRAPRTNWSWG